MELDARGRLGGRGRPAGADRWWGYVPWGEAINRGGVYRDGVELSSEMSALAVCGVAAAINVSSAGSWELRQRML